MFFVCVSLFCGVVLSDHLAEEKRAGCFTLMMLLLSVCVLCPFLMVPWVGLRSVIVAFHTSYSFAFRAHSFQESRSTDSNDNQDCCTSHFHHLPISYIFE